MSTAAVNTNESIYEKDLKDLGRNIMKQRDFLNMSLTDLATDVGTNTATIWMYENGKREMKVTRLFEIADALHITPRELCPKRFDMDVDVDPRIFQLNLQFTKLSTEAQDIVISAMTAMIRGFQKAGK